jgi:dTDP-4-amino-4,6-dideoxygalactose transaminase
LNAGARPVFCDVDPDTYCMTAASAEPAIGERTAALLPVHLFGNPAPIPELVELAAGHGLRVLEDAAQAAGARLGERMAGALADAAVFSFFPSKNLPAFGDGGAIVSHDPELAERCRRLRFHGSEDKLIHTEVGYNSRLDEIQAAALRVLLPELDGWTAARRRVAEIYGREGLGGDVRAPTETDGGESSWHLYVIRSAERERLRLGLEGNGIESRSYYTTPLHRQPALEAYAPADPLPHAEAIAAEGLALPMGQALDPADASQVAAAVRGEPA